MPISLRQFKILIKQLYPDAQIETQLKNKKSNFLSNKNIFNLFFIKFFKN